MRCFDNCPNTENRTYYNTLECTRCPDNSYYGLEWITIDNNDNQRRYEQCFFKECPSYKPVIDIV